NLPQTLHWFRWKTAMTWLNGLMLLIIVYYLGGLINTRVFDDVLISIRVCLILLALAWIVYDSLWRSPLARSEPVAATISFILLVALIFRLTHWMTNRAAFIHIRTMLATFMTANVWVRILPFQRQMVAAIKKGIAPDKSLGARAKQRTKHNNYMVMSVVFIMIS